MGVGADARVSAVQIARVARFARFRIRENRTNPRGSFPAGLRFRSSPFARPTHIAFKWVLVPKSLPEAARLGARLFVSGKCSPIPK